MSRISSTAGRSVSIACSGGCRRAASSRHRRRRTSATTQWVEREHLGHRPAEPLLAGRRVGQSGHRPPGLRHDVGERGVADVELPQGRARAGTRRPIAMQRQPGDQLERLGPLEHRRRPGTVDDLDRTEQAHHQRPRQLRHERRARCRPGTFVDGERVGRSAQDAVQLGDLVGAEADRRQGDARPARAPTGRRRRRASTGRRRPSPATTMATPAAAPVRRADELGVDLGCRRRGDEDDGRLPRLAAGVAGTEDERALRDGGRGADQRGGELEGAVHGLDGVGVAVVEEGVLVDADADEVGRLGEDRRGQRGGDAAEHGVGERRRGVDRRARRAPPGRRAPRHLSASIPSWVSATHGAPTERAASASSSTGACPGTVHDRRAAVPRRWEHGARRSASARRRHRPRPGSRAMRADESTRRGRRGAYGDIDPRQPLAGVDGAQPALGRD